LALFATAAAVAVHAQSTNLLQTVTVEFTAYSQGTPATTANGDVVNIVNHSSFGTKDLISALSASGTVNKGDMLVRETPVTNVVIYVTNLVPVGNTNLVITNISTSLEVVSNDLIFGGVTTYIGNTNVTYGTNILVIDGASVTIGSNTATYGTNVLAIGTNTTVTMTTLTNAAGEITGTSNYFVINALNVTPSTTNKLGTASWVIYNTKTTPKTTPISTNVYFDIHTDNIYGLTNSAYIHGETIKANGEIKFGTTDEIRTLTLSNSMAQIRLVGYAHGVIVPVSLGTTASAEVVDSQNYKWTGSGSGVISKDATPAVIDGNITEIYFKLKD
jgi:hypothetical protein